MIRAWLKDDGGGCWIETDEQAAYAGYDPDIYLPPSVMIPDDLYERYQRVATEMRDVWNELFALEDAARKAQRQGS